MRQERNAQMREERIRRMRKKWVPEHQGRRNISQEEVRTGGETQVKLDYGLGITKAGSSHQENFHFSQ